MPSCLSFLIASVLATGSAASQFERRVVTYANQTQSSTSSSTSAVAPGSVSVSTATVTRTTTSSRNGTITSSASASSTGNTCCYIVNDSVGVNTWYTNTANVTVATAVTYWLKYNNTIIPGNTSIITVPGATDAFGVYAQGGSAYLAGSVPISTVTRTETYGGTVSMYSYTEYNYSYTTPAPIAAVPTTLLNQSGVWYQEQWINAATAMTFPNQSLTVYSPTPYFYYQAIGLKTSAPCAYLTTASSLVSYVTYSTVSGGSTTYEFTTLPVTTFTASSPFADAAGASNTAIPTLVVQPFPPGDYSNFSYAQFIEENGITVEGGGENVFELPQDLPGFLAKIPAIVSAYPGIGSCTVGAGQGEPTVHVPVNTVTADSHVTMTMNGAYNAGATTPDSAVSDVKTSGGQTTQQQSQGTGAASGTTQAQQTGGAQTSGVQSAGQAGSAVQTAGGAQSTGGAGQASQGGGQGSAQSTAGQQSQGNSGSGQSAGQGSAPSNAGQQTQGNGAGSGAGKSQAGAGGTSTSVNIGGAIASVLGMSASTNAAVSAVSAVSAQSRASGANNAGSGSAATTIDASGQPVIVSAVSSGVYNINGQTVSAGGVATANGHTVSVGSSGTAVVVDNSVTAAVVPPNTYAQGVVTVGGSTLTYQQAGSTVVIGSTTVVPGSVATVNGQTVSLASGGSGIVVVSGTQTSTINLSPTTTGTKPAQPQATPYSEGVVTVGSNTYTYDELSGTVVINSQTLKPGSSITIDGETLSLAAGGSGIVAASGTQTVTVNLVATTTKTGAAFGTSSVAAYTAFSNDAGQVTWSTSWSHLWPVVASVMVACFV